MIWFSADLHLGHKNILEYCNRPFNDVDDMDRAIYDNFFESLNSGDVLYMLGDLTFASDRAYFFLSTLDGMGVQTHFILGNHDRKQSIKIIERFCASVNKVKNIKIEEQPITLMHYSMRVWNKSHFNSWQLYGHSHGTLGPEGKQLDVGVDVHKFMPVSYEFVKLWMKSRPDNFNYIKNRDRR